jgi:hypothetical protein
MIFPAAIADMGGFMRFVKYFVMPALGLVIASAAQAQQIGNYTGTTADGSSVTITVAQDPNNENLEVKVISFGITALCQKSKETLYYIGIGLGDGSDIVDGKFSYTSSGFFDINLVTSMTFHGAQSVKGKVGVNFAAFNPAIGHQTLTDKVQVCVSKNQSFSATFSGTEGGLDLPAGTMTVRGPSGATIRRTLKP